MSGSPSKKRYTVQVITATMCYMYCTCMHVHVHVHMHACCVAPSQTKFVNIVHSLGMCL